MRFDTEIKLNLSFLGDGWEDCFLAFSPITIKQAREFRKLDSNDPEILDKGLSLISDLFLRGKGLSNGKTVDITKKDLEDLPMIVINKSIEIMVGSLNEVEKKTLN